MSRIVRVSEMFLTLTIAAACISPIPAQTLHTFDSNGKATVTADVPPGSYYVFSAASGSSGALVWDLPITLKPGDNTITLTATNAELVH